MGLVVTPAFAIMLDGKDITSRVKRNLLGIQLLEYSGRMSDRLIITIGLPETDKILPHGGVLSLSLGAGDILVYKGQFIIDELILSGFPRQLQVVADAAPMDDTRQPATLQSHKTRSFDAITFDTLVTTIAKEHQLRPKVSRELAGQLFTHIDQHNESDINLLTRLAHQYGAVVKPANGYLLLTPDAAGKKVSGADLPVVTLNPKEISSWQIRLTSRTHPGQVVAGYYDVASGHYQTFTAGSGDPVYRIVYQYPNREQAAAAANARLKQNRASSDMIDITLPVQPKFMHLVAESYIQLRGFGYTEDRQWRIHRLEWTIQSSGMTMHLTGDAGKTE
ncbi:contractile injection system protein, VgrG/Pvc8 family [Celerinatantimonas sp. YJH-8]|uniref:contractile injection system protein, VgrG/Pvc8 family n=1 Tax=Celerinatantimonas sp. YJH-8 TaxID=3228714 RepID=UPI0038C213A9